MNEQEPASHQSFARNIIGWVRRCLGKGDPEPTLKDALEEVIQEHEEEGQAGELSRDERDMLRNMLALGETTVSDVMIPRADIVAVDNEITLTELKEILQEKRHTRLPVYKENMDHLSGICASERSGAGTGRR